MMWYIFLFFLLVPPAGPSSGAPAVLHLVSSVLITALYLIGIVVVVYPTTKHSPVTNQLTCHWFEAYRIPSESEAFFSMYSKG